MSRWRCSTSSELRRNCRAGLASWSRPEACCSCHGKPLPLVGMNCDNHLAQTDVKLYASLMASAMIQTLSPGEPMRS